MLSILAKKDHLNCRPYICRPKLSHFFQKKTSKKCDNLGTFTQKVLFLKEGTKCDDLEWGTPD